MWSCITYNCKISNTKSFVNIIPLRVCKHTGVEWEVLVHESIKYRALCLTRNFGYLGQILVITYSPPVHVDNCDWSVIFSPFGMFLFITRQHMYLEGGRTDRWNRAFLCAPSTFVDGGIKMTMQTAQLFNVLWSTH